MSSQIEILSQDSEFFEYRRYRLASRMLGADTTFGVARLKGEEHRRPAGTLYYFHGGNGDDQQPFQLDVHGLIRGDLLERFKQENLQLVFPYIGTSFLHGKHSSQFFDELLKAVEEGTDTVSGTRWIGGLSMGGFAALSAICRRPELFAGVGAQAPALIRFDYTRASEVEAFRGRTGLSPEACEMVVGLYRSEFADHADFSRHDPIGLSRSLGFDGLGGKKIFIGVGSQDELGLVEGTETLSRVLKEADIAHRFEVVPGGKHDAEYVRGQFPRMLEYLLGG